MFLNWITQLVKQAVLKGFREAVEELDLDTTDGSNAELEALKQRMNALPAPANGKKAKADKQ